MLGKFVLPTPDGLYNTNLDNIAADSLPLLTMLACIPSLRLFARHRKHVDLVDSMLTVHRSHGGCHHMLRLLNTAGSALPHGTHCVAGFQTMNVLQDVVLT